MFQLVKCRECGGSDTGIGEICVDIVLSESSWCNKCRKPNTKTKTYFFCSHNCFMKYIKKVVDGDEVFDINNETIY